MNAMSGWPPLLVQVSVAIVKLLFPRNAGSSFSSTCFMEAGNRVSDCCMARRHIALAAPKLHASVIKEPTTVSQVPCI